MSSETGTASDNNYNSKISKEKHCKDTKYKDIHNVKFPICKYIYFFFHLDTSKMPLCIGSTTTTDYHGLNATLRRLRTTVVYKGL